ncbi:(2Fe-2S)-binding protein [Alteromonas sp. 009811495]|uniref:(2Fe-2S)-binding protein n=1 Tax=Alteromonas sp. 009811495 TaxID=3002962 RepID=UPI00237E003D|nr:(2Fe-2S)-binding protein [Alteromonas sp. 009811495]WDT84493.1 (2Fe-2S)-binding protein [Alteromonas sp. 009811495]
MITFTVNGIKHEFSGDSSTPVLWYLRDELNLTGPKFGCGMAQCGACTVHIDGVAQRSCVLPVSAVQGRNITTIEGLSEDGDHPVQQAWIEHQVPQCGFCQCGQIMQAASLLASNPNPTDKEIVQNMSGNICRCGTYPRIHKAIKSAAKSMSANAGVNYFTPQRSGEEV